MMLGKAMTGLKLSCLESFSVDHCAQAWGLNLRSDDGWSLAYSGDTRPCNNVVAAARDALILIHEVGIHDTDFLHTLPHPPSETCTVLHISWLSSIGASAEFALCAIAIACKEP